MNHVTIAATYDGGWKQSVTKQRGDPCATFCVTEKQAGSNVTYTVSVYNTLVDRCRALAGDIVELTGTQRWIGTRPHLIAYQFVNWTDAVVRTMTAEQFAERKRATAPRDETARVQDDSGV